MRRMQWMGVACALPLAVACAEAVEPTGAASAEIGVEGGTVASRDGRVVLDVPAGALSAPTVISIEDAVSVPFAEELVGAAYRFGPHGLTFDADVTVVFQVTEPDASLDYEVVNLDGEAPAAIEASAWDPVSGTLTAPLQHFSRYGVRVRHAAHRFGACVRRCVAASDDRSTCAARCAEALGDDHPGRHCGLRARHLYERCVEGGGEARACRARAVAAAERCGADDDDGDDDDGDDDDDVDRCPRLARRVYGACIDAGGTAEDCRARAARVLDRCEDAGEERGERGERGRGRGTDRG